MNPECLAFTLVSKCRMVCDYCPQKPLAKNYPKSGSDELSYENFIKMVDKSPQYIHIHFSGFTEPFLNEAAPSMIAYAALRRPVHIYTTLYGLTIRGLEQIAMQTQFERVRFHLPDAGGRMKLPIDRRYLNVLDLVFSPHSNVFDAKKVDFVCVGDLHPDVKKIVEKNGAMSMWAGLGLNSRAQNVSVGGKKVSVAGPITCKKHPKLRESIIMPNGDVQLCCSDFGLDEKIGNLLDQEYDEIFKSDAFRDVVARMKTGDIMCNSCEYAQGS